MSIHQRGPESVDEYIAGIPAYIQRRLKRLRATIKKVAPDAEERISYQIPTFTFMGHLISFAAYKKHIGLYPAPLGTERFNKKLAPYRAEKSTVRFPLDKPIPFDLIAEIVELRVKENLHKARMKKK